MRIFMLFAIASLQAPGQCYAQELPDLSAEKLVKAAIERTKQNVTYDGSYRSMQYPAGDVPNNIGVCTDLIVRSYRALGIDLQLLVHEDMAHNFDKYPQLWGHSGPDTNIDHRRVPNLQTFLERHGAALVPSRAPSDYRPGDLVTWLLPGNLPHIGIVTHLRSESTRQPLIVHNIGYGPALEDILFSFKITGHYRYRGTMPNIAPEVAR